MTCNADRLPADYLDNAVLAALLAADERTDPFDRAIAAARGEISHVRTTSEGELVTIGIEIGKAEASSFMPPS
jgi:hypothetical protein